jgi:hypothetical protein
VKIIYLVESKFCKRDYNRFGLDILTKRGYSDIEVWDFSCWFRLKYFKKYTPKDLLLGKGYISITNKSLAMKLLKELPYDCIFIILFGVHAKSIDVFNYLNKHRYKYGFVSFGLLPPVQHSLLTKIKIEATTPIQAFKFLSRKILGKVKIYVLGSIIRPKFVILGGSAATSKFIRDETILLKSHTLDYNLFINLKSEKSIEQDEKYAVFLDEGSPYHPDTIGEATSISPECYYPILNSFFDYIEFDMGIKVIISPHPRSNYAKTGNPFNDRSIVSQPACSVVKNSEFVMAHSSTSVGFAVLHKRPILFLNSRTFHCYTRSNIDGIARFFRKKSVDISKPDFVVKRDELVIEDKVYNTYKDLYIKEKGTSEENTWDVFCDFLDKVSAE